MYGSSFHGCTFSLRCFFRCRTFSRFCASFRFCSLLRLRSFLRFCTFSRFRSFFRLCASSRLCSFFLFCFFSRFGSFFRSCFFSRFGSFSRFRSFLLSRIPGLLFLTFCFQCYRKGFRKEDFAFLNSNGQGLSGNGFVQICKSGNHLRLGVAATIPGCCKHCEIDTGKHKDSRHGKCHTPRDFLSDLQLNAAI